MTSSYLKNPLRTRQQALDDMWRAVDSWSKPRETKCARCDFEAEPGEALCADCASDERSRLEKEREQEREYRGPNRNCD